MIQLNAHVVCTYMYIHVHDALQSTEYSHSCYENVILVAGANELLRTVIKLGDDMIINISITIIIIIIIIITSIVIVLIINTAVLYFLFIIIIMTLKLSITPNIPNMWYLKINSNIMVSLEI